MVFADSFASLLSSFVDRARGVFLTPLIASLALCVSSCQLYRQQITHADGTTVDNVAVQLPFSKVESGLFEAYTDWASDGSGQMVTGAAVERADTSEGLNILAETLGAALLQALGIYAANPGAFRPPSPQPEPLSPLNISPGLESPPEPSP